MSDTGWCDAHFKTRLFIKNAKKTRTFLVLQKSDKLYNHQSVGIPQNSMKVAFLTFIISKLSLFQDIDVVFCILLIDKQSLKYIIFK